MKRILNVLLVLMLAFVTAFNFAACVDNSDNDTTKKGLSYKKIDGVYTIYKYVAEDGVDTLDIGAILSEAGITNVTIKKGAFDGNSSIKNLIISNAVTEIQAGAFRNMTALENLEVPFIGRTAKADAFDGETAKAEDKAVDGARTIAHFFGTEEYTEGKSVTVNYGSGTASCYIPYTLTKVTVNGAAGYKIPMYAFNGAPIKTVVIKEGTAVIGENAFANCASLTSVELPASIKTIYKNAFNTATILKNVTFADGASEVVIKDKAFEGCASISYIGKKVSELPANTIDLTVVSEIGFKALDFGNENKTYTVVAGTIAAENLTSALGDTKIAQ